MTPTQQQRSVALDVARVLAIACVFLVHAIEPHVGYLRALNIANGWGTVRERFREWWPHPAGGAEQVTAVVRDLGSLGDQAVGVFILVTGIALTMSVSGRQKSLATGPEKRAWWSAHYWAIGVGWVLAHVGLAVLSWLTSNYQASPGWWQFWVSLVGVRFTPTTMYYGLAAWWYVGLLVQLYLIFPWLWRSLQRLGARRFLVATVPVLIIVRLLGLLLLHGAWLDVWSRGGFALTRLPEFILGMVAGWWLSHSGVPVDDEIRRLGSPRVLALALVTWMVGVLAGFTVVGMSVAFLLITAGFCTVLLIIGARLKPSRVLTWASSRAYDFYLVHHLPCLVFMGAVTVVSAGSLIRLTLALGGSLVGAEILHRLSRFVLARRSPFLRGRTQLVLATCTALALGFVATAEKVSQHVSPQEPLGWGERPSMTSDDAWGWKLKPRSVTHLRWVNYDYTVSAGADGLPAVAPTPGGSPVVVLGDAFSSAEGVDTDKSWVGLLGEASSGKFSVVKNASVSGWGPSQEARAATDVIRATKPKTVIVETFVNDLLDVQLTDQQFRHQIGFDNPSAARLPGLMAGANLRASLPSLRGVMGRQGVDSAGYGFLDLMGEEPDPSLDEAARTAAGEFTQIKQAADAAGAQVVVVLVPSAAQVCRPADLAYLSSDFDPADYDLDKPQRLLKGAWAAAGVTDVLDLRTAFAEGACPYVPNNMHWTPEGHARVAAAVAEHLAGR